MDRILDTNTADYVQAIPARVPLIRMVSDNTAYRLWTLNALTSFYSIDHVGLLNAPPPATSHTAMRAHFHLGAFTFQWNVCSS